MAKKIFDLAIPNLEMMVVDDNSPDGTAELAKELGKKYPLKLIQRKKRGGLGTAYALAFKTLLELPNAQKPDIIIQMDADISHSPAAIPKFLEKIKSHDVVLGSRYIPGGTIENWDFARKFLSSWGNHYARIILGLPYKDLTGGFKCWRREVLEKIDLDSLSSVGYNFQIETTYKAHAAGNRIAEIPISFTERKRGKSKMNFKIILESFWKVLKLRIFG